MTYTIAVENKFEMAQRDIRVRRKVWEETQEDHRVPYPIYVDGVGQSQIIDLALGAVDSEEDYLEISMDDRQADLGPCKIDLPANAPFTFIPSGTGSFTVIPPENGGTLTSVKIPSGTAAWILEVMKPVETEPEAHTGNTPKTEDDDGGGANNVTIGDDEPGGGG